MKFGLKEETILKIQDAIRKNPSIQSVTIFGSQAKGNFKPGSDIDLALYGNDLNLKDITKLMVALDELLLPYTFDICIYEDIENPEFREHIDRVGQVFFKI